MAIAVDTHQAVSNAIAARGNYIAVYTGAGAGTTGANEASGGPYARKPTNWTPDGAGNNNGSPTDVPVGPGTYTEGGIHSAVTGGNFVGSGPFTSGSVIVQGTGVTITVTPKINSKPAA
ncbi:hypothetical protein FZI85_25225 [Mycobacterium sp. CBMA293]|uniref:phage tail fiber protein n=1 Tax=unclassified Mycolicibacterium TaxID=2636767 RepID=UPI001324D144|nr:MULTISPECIES: hypothetical protein [unclassified Mycolicibacterium]MUL47618.1 hypothetical protein [Mycolicibacterium sp. CBMA 360]MUL61864.1 hypothetical protein [Mycolicibacterium sp. CBMA 335]MUL68937.1 hypothetical protein [Mycolicibacterium sp. CBMA 311]MUL92846.1 hypothetical protein [Mycolicibacterium sp. CBMA 230]MUM08711.1 hypothetical protein [Mycolicibacterium sp. CBMA 213]